MATTPPPKTSAPASSRPTLALTREISPRIAECELTHLERRPIDLERARRQHRAYEETLRRLGVEVVRIEPAPRHPDSVFVEDTAVVLAELAVITRPGAESRRGELAGVERALSGRRPLARIEPPATLDGGDVVVDGRTILVGRSARTDQAGIDQLAALAAPHGYRTRAIAVRGCLHLKTAATSIADGVLLVNPEWLELGDLPPSFEIVEIDPTEPAAANVLRVGERLVVPEEHPRTRARLEQRGFEVHAVPAGELAKAEGGLTCCSLLF